MKSFLTTDTDGNWAEWTTWGKCSKSCDSGVQTRSRTCSNPPPSGDGETCVGKASEEKDCNTEDCSGMTIFSKKLNPGRF